MTRERSFTVVLALARSPRPIRLLKHGKYESDPARLRRKAARAQHCRRALVAASGKRPLEQQLNSSSSQLIEHVDERTSELGR